MNNKIVSSDLVLTLQKERGSICVSVIVPTHETSPERRADILTVKRAVEKAKQALAYKYSEKEANLLGNKLDTLVASVDFLHNTQGLGLYVSHGIAVVTQFPFAVDEKVMADDHFDLRDLLYQLNYASPYFALLISEHEIKLWEGRWNQLNEMKGRNSFPLLYEEEYIYDPPSRSTSYAGHTHVKSFEPDKSVLEEERFTTFFRKADQLLKHYLLRDTPLVVLGPEKELSWFRKITSCSKNMIHSVKGNYGHYNTKQLSDIVWPVVYNFFQSERIKLIKEFEEMIGAHRGISGIQEVWNAAKEGRGLKLLVEKDFCSPGFVTQHEFHLYLRPPKEAHKIVQDAVNEIIATVLEKNGNVFFVDNGLLHSSGRIALITRY